MIRKIKLQKMAKFVLFLVLMVFVVNMAFPQNKKTNKHYYKLFTNTCDSINFVTIQFILKDSTKHNLNKFKYNPELVDKINSSFKYKKSNKIICGIDEKYKDGNVTKYKNGMLLKYISYYQIKKDKKRDSTLYKLCQSIEKIKKGLRKTIKEKTNQEAFDTLLSYFIKSVIDTTTSYYPNVKISQLKKNFNNKFKTNQSKIKKKETNTIKSNVYINNKTSPEKTGNQNNKDSTKISNTNTNQNDSKNVSTNYDKDIVGLKNDIESLKKNKKDITRSLNKNKPFLCLALVLSILSIVFWIIFFISNYRKSKKHLPHDDTIDHLNKIIFPHYDKEIDAINNQVKSVVNELSGLQKSLKMYIVRIESITKAMEKTSMGQESFVDEQEETTPAPIPTKQYYLPFPDKQGFFWDDKKSETPVSSSIYILELEGNNTNRGSFTLNLQNEKNIKTALTNPTTFLKPVSKSIDNNFIGKNLEVIEKGELQLIDGRWSINGGKKLVIKIS